MLPARLLLLMCLMHISSALIAQNEPFEVTCGTFDVDVELNGLILPTNPDPDNPIEGKALLYEYLANAQTITVSTSQGNPFEDFDSQIHIFEPSFAGLIPLYYDDNSNPSTVGHALIEANLTLGKTYIIAISGVNGEEGETVLTIDGECETILSSAIAAQPLECNITEDLFFGEIIGPLIDDFHIQPCGDFVFPIEESAFASFQGNGEEMTILFSYDTPGIPQSGRAILKREGNTDQECLFDIEWNDSEQEVNSFTLQTEHLTTYTLHIQLNGTEEFGVQREMNAIVTTTGSCEFEGTYNDPIPLFDGFTINGNTSEFQESNTPCATLNSGEGVFHFEGDGQDHEVTISGGYSYTARCGLLSVDQCDYYDPVELAIFSVENGTETCITTLTSQEYQQASYTFNAEAGVDYYVVIYFPIGIFDVDETFRINYAMSFGGPFQFGNDTIEGSAQEITCGESKEVGVNQGPEESTSIETACGAIEIDTNTINYFVGDGDTYTIQTVRRTDSFYNLSNSISVLSEQAGELVCELYQVVGNNDGFTQLTLPTVNERLYYILVESDLEASSEVYDLEVYTPFCGTCFGAYSEEGFPLDPDHPFIQTTVAEYPACCILGWTETCDEYIREVVLFDEIISFANHLDCGIYEPEFRQQFQLFEEISVENGTGTFAPKGTMDLVSFTGTGEEMTLTTIALSTPTLFFQNDLNEWEFEVNNEFGVSTITLDSELGKTYYLASVPDDVTYGDEEPDYELTITDINNCGICDAIFFGEIDVPLNDGTFEAVVNLNPSCCSDWTAGCQSTYDFFYFPNCATATNMECGETYSGSNVGTPIYVGHNCDGDPFTAGSEWYSLEGDGKTYEVTILSDDVAGPFDSDLYVFTGECPFLNCQGSNGTDGLNGMGELTIPTSIGTTYYFAVTGVNGAEGAYQLQAVSTDYCGQCFTEYDEQHPYDGNSNVVYQQVIEAMPNCCASFWDFDCQTQYDFLLCSLSNEPNNTDFDATELAILDFFNVQASTTGALSSQEDVDIYRLDVNQPGQLYLNLVHNLPFPDPDLALYKDGVQIAISDVGASFEFIDQLIEQAGTGVYYVHVFPKAGSDFSANECYELYVDWIPEEDPGCTLSVSVDDVTGCDSATNTYSVDLEVLALNVGGNTWVINGEEYPIGDQLEMITLPNLPSDGSTQSLYIAVKENPACQTYIESAYTAPEACMSAGCVMDGNGDGLINSADLLEFLGVFGTTCL